MTAAASRPGEPSPEPAAPRGWLRRAVDAVVQAFTDFGVAMSGLPSPDAWPSATDLPVNPMHHRPPGEGTRENG